MPVEVQVQAQVEVQRGSLRWTAVMRRERVCLTRFSGGDAGRGAAAAWHGMLHLAGRIIFSRQKAVGASASEQREAEAEWIALERRGGAGSLSWWRRRKQPGRRGRAS